jgi:hypothetical protein
MKEAISSVFSTSRVITFLSPVFTAGAAVFSAWAANHGIPGVTKGEIEAAEIAGATGAVGAVLMWFRGQHKFEQAKTDLEKDLIGLSAGIDDAKPFPGLQTPASPTVQTVESIIERAKGELDALGVEAHVIEPPNPSAPQQGA